MDAFSCSEHPSSSSVLSTVFADFLPVLLGNEVDETLVQTLLQDQTILNAMFDLTEKIYQRHTRTLHDLPEFEQSTLAAILRQGRLVQHYFADMPELFGSLPKELSNPNLPKDDVIEHNPLLKQAENPNDLSHYKTLNPYNILAIIAPVTAKRDVGYRHNIQKIWMQCNANAKLPLDLAQPITTLNLTQSQSPHSAQVIKMPHFQMPNARVGQPYQAQIFKQGSSPELAVLDTVSIEIPEQTGLIFDADQQQFSGIPLQSGDYQIRFNYQQKDGTWRAGSCTLIINADPRSLWQVNEPDENLPFQKPHTAQQFIDNNAFKIVVASRRGRSHEHAGSFRDDDFFIQTVGNSNWSVMIVADGAGSAPFSREGSRITVQTTGEILTDYVTSHHVQLDEQLDAWQIGSTDDSTIAASEILKKEFYGLFYQAAQRSIKNIEQQAQQQAVSSKFFATTLLAAVVRQQSGQTFVSTFWIGDGAIAVYSPQKVRLMGKADGGEYAGQTRFLDHSVLASFNERVNMGYFNAIDAVILMTDGISDPKFETDAGLQNQQKWDALWQELNPVLRQPNPDATLLDWIHFFSAGHHDDRTLAVLWSEQANDFVIKNDHINHETEVNAPIAEHDKNKDEQA